MIRPSITLLSQGFPQVPGLDIAIGAALLDRASNGGDQESFRLNRPGRVVAFGKRDALSPGYRAAVSAAHATGFEPVVRLAGGRAAVFHEGTLAFGWTIPLEDPRRGIRDRFEWAAELMLAAFAGLGARAEIGEIPGEYCPGEFSINIDGELKVMGVGQRLARRAAHVGGVVVVERADLVNRALTPVYESLGLDWRPEATGALDNVLPGVTTEDVAASITENLKSRTQLTTSELDPELLRVAASLAPELLSPRP